jgi:hypothetical protein
MTRSVLKSVVFLLIWSTLAEQTFAQGVVAQGVGAQADARASSADTATAPDTEYVFVPRDTQIAFTGPEAVPFASVRQGTAVEFVLDRDVLLGGVRVVHGGIPTAGIATRVLHGSRLRHRDGQMQIRVTEMVSGRAKELLLTVFNPDDAYAEYPDTYRDCDRPSLVKPLVFLGVILLLMLAALHD